MKDNQFTFVFVLIVLMSIAAFIFFLQEKGIDIKNLDFRPPTTSQPNPLDFPGKIKLTSKAFENEGMIPADFTCIGADVNPELKISGIPYGTKSWALLMEDPDAPYKTWVHWIIYNILPSISEIRENTFPPAAMGGESDFGTDQYRGPCPPTGRHQYVFTVYALDTKLDLERGASKGELLKAMEGHILDSTQLVGYFEK